jgi:hypothetical protein
VVHTSHPTCGYQIEAAGVKIVWAPEFYAFPRWARGADVMFAEAAAWNRPIRFVGGVGGHLDVQAVARSAQRNGIKRLVFAHIGRPTLRALDRGLQAPFGEFARDGQVFVCRRKHVSARRCSFTRPVGVIQQRGRLSVCPIPQPLGSSVISSVGAVPSCPPM